MGDQLTTLQAAREFLDACNPIAQALAEDRLPEEDELKQFRRKLGLLRLAVYFEQGSAE